MTDMLPTLRAIAEGYRAAILWAEQWGAQPDDELIVELKRKLLDLLIAIDKEQANKANPDSPQI